MMKTEITKERLSEFFYPTIGWNRTDDNVIVDYAEVEINPEGIKKLEDNLERYSGMETKEQNPWLFNSNEDAYEHIIAYVHFNHGTTDFNKLFIEVYTSYDSEPLEVEKLINDEEKNIIIEYAKGLVISGIASGKIA